MLPPVRVEDGSTASTATRCPRAVSMLPNASMNVDLPTPGTPVMPMRVAFPAYGASCTSSSWASARWSARLDSTSVIARARSARVPPRTRSTHVADLGPRRRGPHPWSGAECPRRVERLASSSTAASAMTVPGGKIAAAPAARSSSKSWERDHPADDDHDVVAAQRGELARRAGTSVRCPAASE